MVQVRKYFSGDTAAFARRVLSDYRTVRVAQGLAANQNLMRALSPAAFFKNIPAAAFALGFEIGSTLGKLVADAYFRQQNMKVDRDAVAYRSPFGVADFSGFSNRSTDIVEDLTYFPTYSNWQVNGISNAGSWPIVDPNDVIFTTHSAPATTPPAGAFSGVEYFDTAAENETPTQWIMRMTWKQVVTPGVLWRYDILGVFVVRTNEAPNDGQFPGPVPSTPVPPAPSPESLVPATAPAVGSNAPALRYVYPGVEFALPAPLLWTIDPVSRPVFAPDLVPQAIPFWLLPHLRYNPQRVEQRDVAYGLRPQPRLAPYEWPMVYGESVLVFDAQGNPSLVRKAGGSHVRMPPPRGTKERKVSVPGQAMAMLAVNSVREAAELVDIMFFSLPKRIWVPVYRKNHGQVTVPDKLKLIYQHLDQLSLREVFERKLIDTVQDTARGFSGRAARDVARRFRPHGNLPFGFEFGPAL